jgi:hypothetical protein
VLHIARSFQPACVLAVAVDLDVFNALHGRPIIAETLAANLNINLRATTILLDALTSMELLTKYKDVYSIPDEIVYLFYVGFN